MAYKVFSNGNTLNASELNTYLMNQSVMVFASTSARDAALTSPVEGMLVWLEDSNKYVYFTGSAWSDLIAPASSGNAIINGAFEINQRNFTSTTTSGTYGFDRWTYFASGGTATYSAQTFTPGAAPVAGYEAANFARIVTSGQSGSGDYSAISQSIENVRTFAGQTATISFWAKAASGTPKIAVEFRQNFGSGGSPSSFVDAYAGQVTVSTSWTRYSLTVAIPALTGKTIGTTANTSSLVMNAWVSAGSSLDARTGSLGIQNNTFDIWGVQLESGSTATAFKRNASNIQGELAACQRYYWRIQASAAYSYFSQGFANSSTGGQLLIKAPTTMRVMPTSIDYPTVSTLRVWDGINSIQLSSLGLGANSGSDTIQLDYTVSSGLTQYRYYHFGANNSATAYLGLSAEL
jgi:hypothetical protein